MGIKFMFTGGLSSVAGCLYFHLIIYLFILFHLFIYFRLNKNKCLQDQMSISLDEQITFRSKPSLHNYFYKTNMRKTVED